MWDIVALLDSSRHHRAIASEMRALLQTIKCRMAAL
jgi:hypothetical protein